MSNNLLEHYNYDEFIPSKFEPWLRFAESPLLGRPAPDFQLWDLDEQETNLSTILKANLFTVVEFGSFT